MGFFRGVKRFVKPFIDVPRWMQWSKLVSYGRDIRVLASKVFVLKEAQSKESFNEACQRFGLTPEELQLRYRGLKRLLTFYLASAIIILGYTIYLFSQGYIRGGLSGLAVTAAVMAFAFRQHFWMTQIRLGHLGLSLQAWRQSIFSKGRDA